ncbi:Rossmann-like and DUF2520 domain-containing protein [Clostridium sp. DJ247]|uniref:Rossmann-like and DUF2520 domain-containing protein n=1 Tax=Clostridium sp. DJ247 TaxID=2726188 RepID=UPI001625B7CB|nr:Rossmann-like and DUF2520 domain-containing protein [Clostridium sp. DJ247]MBC2580730.1 DUF2520 domain-containing protein [Clostridium sp. DJ247]
MKIGFIGAGKVGFSLGKYFVLNNIDVIGYYSKSYKSALDAASFTNTEVYTCLEKLVNHSDTIFITTPDDEISCIWQNIQRFNIKDKIICHVSGSLSSKIFSNINQSGAFGYSIHPMFPFSDKYTTYKNLKKAYFSIEGCEEYLNRIKGFIEGLGNKVIVRDGDKTELYHLANVTVSNLVLSLISLGCTYLQKCNVSYEDSIKALLPLIENNIENIKNSGVIHAITGPVERCDVKTIKKHMEVIPEEHILLYKVLSQNLLELSKQKNSEKNYETLEDYLGGSKNEKYNSNL